MKIKYENCEMRDPGGLFLAFCSKKRANWYIKKGLADIVKQDPLVFNLKFAPNGTGHRGEAFFEEPLENICVVCGVSNELTRHHVVPSCYRKYFPENKKSYNNHDILLLCKDCHSLYETKAFEFKKTLMLANGLNPQPQPDPHLKFLRKKANTILSFELPAEKYIENMDPLEQHFGHTPTDKELQDLLEIEENLSECVKLVSIITDIDKFCKEWREHFTNTMSPKHLPKGWHIDYIVDF